MGVESTHLSRFPINLPTSLFKTIKKCQGGREEKRKKYSLFQCPVQKKGRDRVRKPTASEPFVSLLRHPLTCHKTKRKSCHRPHRFLFGWLSVTGWIITIHPDWMASVINPHNAWSASSSHMIIIIILSYNVNLLWLSQQMNFKYKIYCGPYFIYLQCKHPRIKVVQPQ